MSDATWTEYYDEYEDREPREMLLRVLDVFGPGHRSWLRERHRHVGHAPGRVAVFATDAEFEGIRRLRGRDVARG